MKSKNGHQKHFEGKAYWSWLISDQVLGKSTFKIQVCISRKTSEASTYLYHLRYSWISVLRNLINLKSPSPLLILYKHFIRIKDIFINGGIRRSTIEHYIPIIVTYTIKSRDEEIHL